MPAPAEYLIGQRVITPMGVGTITGFEWFSDKLNADRVSSKDAGGRAIVRLDDPAAWKPTLLTPHPYMSRSDLKEF